MSSRGTRVFSVPHAYCIVDDPIKNVHDTDVNDDREDEDDRDVDVADIIDMDDDDDDEMRVEDFGNDEQYKRDVLDPTNPSIVLVTARERQKWTYNSKKLYCANCLHRVSYVKPFTRKSSGQRVVAHFRHRAGGSGCTVSKEIALHNARVLSEARAAHDTRGKWHVSQQEDIAIVQMCEVILRNPRTNKLNRADVFQFLRGTRVELQDSPISQADVVRRTRFRGVMDAWARTSDKSYEKRAMLKNVRVRECVWIAKRWRERAIDRILKIVADNDERTEWYEYRMIANDPFSGAVETLYLDVGYFDILKLTYISKASDHDASSNASTGGVWRCEPLPMSAFYRELYGEQGLRADRQGIENFHRLCTKDRRAFEFDSVVDLRADRLERERREAERLAEQQRLAEQRRASEQRRAEEKRAAEQRALEEAERKRVEEAERRLREREEASRLQEEERERKFREIEAREQRERQETELRQVHKDFYAKQNAQRERFNKRMQAMRERVGRLCVRQAISDANWRFRQEQLRQNCLEREDDQLSLPPASSNIDPVAAVVTGPTRHERQEQRREEAKRQRREERFSKDARSSMKMTDMFKRKKTPDDDDDDIQ